MLRKLLFLLSCLFSSLALSAPIHIVAAENFYGDIAEQIAGKYADVLSIMTNPNQDPHLFSLDITTAKTLSNADIIIYNGIDYDPWIINLLASNHQKNKTVIVVADLIGKKSGSNPHIWYDPNTVLIYANHLTEQLIKLDPIHRAYYQERNNQLQKKGQQLLTQIKQIKQMHQGTPIIATEPVFDYMSTLLGLQMHGNDFQLSIMNDSEPSAKSIQDFVNKLQQHKVNVLIFNNQVTGPLTDRLKMLAQQSSIPIVGVSELEPPKQNYFTWMENQLLLVNNALGKK